MKELIMLNRWQCLLQTRLEPEDFHAILYIYSYITSDDSNVILEVSTFVL